MSFILKKYHRAKNSYKWKAGHFCPAQNLPSATLADFLQ